MFHLCLKKKKKSAAKYIDNLQVSKMVFVLGSPSLDDPNGGPRWWNIINQAAMAKEVGGC